MKPKKKKEVWAFKTKIKKKHPAPKCSNNKGRSAWEEQHEIFCAAYVINFNATKAYEKAYPGSKGAAVSASQLLTNPKIAARVSALVAERKRKIALSGDDILEKITDLAVSDVRQLINEKTLCVLPPSQWPDDIALAVSSIEVKELIHPRTGRKYGEIKKIKLWDKPKPLELLGRNKKLFTDVVENKDVPYVAATDEQVDAAHTKFKDKL